MPLIYPKSRVLARRKQMVWEQMHSGLGPALEQVHPKHGTCPPKPLCCKKSRFSSWLLPLCSFPLCFGKVSPFPLQLSSGFSWCQCSLWPISLDILQGIAFENMKINFHLLADDSRLYLSSPDLPPPAHAVAQPLADVST